MDSTPSSSIWTDWHALAAAAANSSRCSAASSSSGPRTSTIETGPSIRTRNSLLATAGPPALCGRRVHARHTPSAEGTQRRSGAVGRRDEARFEHPEPVLPCLDQELQIAGRPPIPSAAAAGVAVEPGPHQACTFLVEPDDEAGPRFVDVEMVVLRPVRQRLAPHRGVPWCPPEPVRRPVEDPAERARVEYLEPLDLDPTGRHPGREVVHRRFLSRSGLSGQMPEVRMRLTNRERDSVSFRFNDDRALCDRSPSDRSVRTEVMEASGWRA